MQKVVELCKRVEGHGKIDIYLQNDIISEINFDLAAYRGFESILKNKDLLDIPRIASRICGLCHASQSIASCKAIESIFGVRPTEKSILLRRLLMIGELIKSHSMHFFFQAFPDLLYLFGYKTKPPQPNELIQFDADLTTKFYELIKIGNDIDRLFGGRSIHLVTTIPGSTIHSKTLKNIKISSKYLQKAEENLNYIIDRFIKLFSKFSPPNFLDLHNPIYMSLNNNESYDRYDGNLKMDYGDNKIVKFFVENYLTYFDKDPELRGINFRNDERVIVGPIARYNNTKNFVQEKYRSGINKFDNTWIHNGLFSNFLRLLEMAHEVERALDIMNDPILKKQEDYEIPKNIQKKDGIGIVEAPRGILLHHYHLDKNDNVDKVKLFIATEINIPSINKILMDFSKELYNKTGDINLIKEKAQIIIRSFDPCIACASH
ncbi:MAG: putative F420-nonreducing hydrogenase [Promethearchaeota archaeon]|nr:MAG: putative F420-nonreducing hydrogenase [Candidatus Lokiarchaeota archaeon]